MRNSLTGQNPNTRDRIVRMLVIAGILAGVIWLVGYLSDVLIPFAVALLLVYYRRLIAPASPAISGDGS
jgi:predicted PurR-regulated permease PerM